MKKIILVLFFCCLAGLVKSKYDCCSQCFLDDNEPEVQTTEPGSCPTIKYVSGG